MRYVVVVRGRGLFVLRFVRFGGVFSTTFHGGSFDSLDCFVVDGALAVAVLHRDNHFDFGLFVVMIVSGGHYAIAITVAMVSGGSYMIMISVVYHKWCCAASRH